MHGGALQKDEQELKLKTERFFNGTKITIESNGQTFHAQDVTQISRGSRTISLSPSDTKFKWLEVLRWNTY